MKIQHPVILVAEDDAEDRFFMAQTFKELGMDGIKFVDDGTGVIAHLDETDKNSIKLIILDLNMPKLNGTETLRLLKQSAAYQHIPVIIFSTSMNTTEKGICMALGAREYVVKPFSYNEYVNLCRRFYELSQTS